MPQDEALFQAILDEPDDDGVRLVYADWLEERGDAARAEFIRVQIELSRREAADPFAPPFAKIRVDRRQTSPSFLDPLERREQLLLAEHGAAWKRDLPAWARRLCRFYRGFPSVILSTGPQWQAEAERLCRITPVEELWLTDTIRDWAGMARVPQVAHLRGLAGSLYPGRVPDPADAAEMAANVEALVGCPYLGDLRRLQLTGWQITPPAARALARANWPALTTLRLTVTPHQIRWEGEEIFTAGPLLAGVEWLSLTDAPRAGAEAAASLAASPYLRRLRVLEAWSSGLGDAGARALAGCPGLTGLRALHLGHNGIGAAGATALAASPHFRALERLYLDGNQIGDAGAEALAASPSLARVTHLQLAGNGVGDAGARALARSPHLGRLERVYLGGNPISPSARQAVRERFGAAAAV
jgi:uncharacterized protein (TIGR02996 family)